MADRELTGKELERIDVVHNAIYNMVESLVPDGYDKSKLEWDMEWIGEISDMIEEILEERLKVKPYDFCPFVELDP